MKLSVVYAVRNEAKVLGKSLTSVKTIADEIIVVDDASTDETSEVAKSYGAKVFTFKHTNNFHEAKQYAIDKAKGNWILQLDADEIVTPNLSKEIAEVINSTNEKLLKRKAIALKQNKLFARHQYLIEKREGHLGKLTGEVVAFFVPRVNIFMGKPLVYGGVYPDGVIRLIKRGKARLPAKSVHELMEVDGEVAWLSNDLEHHDSPTFARYLQRNKRYVEDLAKTMSQWRVPKNLFYFYIYSIHKPIVTFLSLYLRHKSILDGWRGFVWSLFSALRFPRAYITYWQTVKSEV